MGTRDVSWPACIVDEISRPQCSWATDRKSLSPVFPEFLSKFRRLIFKLGADVLALRRRLQQLGRHNAVVDVSQVGLDLLQRIDPLLYSWTVQLAKCLQSVA